MKEEACSEAAAGRLKGCAAAAAEKDDELDIMRRDEMILIDWPRTNQANACSRAGHARWQRAAAAAAAHDDDDDEGEQKITLTTTTAPSGEQRLKTLETSER